MKVLDISVQLQAGMVRYPSAYLPDVQMVPAATHEKEGRSVHILTFGTHVSTHVDAPLHAVPGGASVDGIPPEHFFGPARLVRFSDRDKSTPLDAGDFEKIAGLEACEKIVLDTGWARRTWGGADYFTEGPFLTREASRYLASLPRLHLIGMDFPNVDSRQDMIMGHAAPNHRILLGKNIVLLENLFRLEEVPSAFLLSAAPPRLVGGDGCPCRALAIFPPEDVPGFSRG